MKPLRISYFSATATEIPSLSAGVRRFKEQGGCIEVKARTRAQLSSERQIEAFVKDAITAHAVLVVLHGGKASFPAFELLVNELKERRNRGKDIPYVHIHASGRDEDGLDAARDFSDAFGTSQWDKINAYLTYGGYLNFYNLFLLLHNLILKGDNRIEEATPLPHEGIYHPDVPGIPGLHDYLEQRVIHGRMTAGLWFYQSYWVNGNLEYIDAIIREIERRGANVIPVFHHRWKDKVLGNQGADHIASHFFMDGDHPRIDVLINPMMFSLTIAAPEYKEILPRLDVPFIQAITMMNTRRYWEENLQGVSIMDVSYSAAQPEFDGALITVPIASREQDEIDPLTGALLAKNVPIPDRVEKMVSIALNWARLRHLGNHEKKVAIVFHNYPPRNDRIGCAAGLDSFASIKHLLDQMKKEGYRVERLYENGDELAKELLSGLTWDGRWLTSERMAERAVAVADEDRYRAWHRGLPARIGEKITEDWGRTPGELFVHDGKMLFPGTINGNIFITIQPPRGYLENMDKIYHDLYLSPPHNYLAHYRWIKEVFGADAVIHVGKHGSLEWLPGKALGLSRYCYPDLAIIDLPNIYPYIINDPSEGTQAKRRSFCCIIDHLTPVFTNAGLYEDLAKLENLLKEYADASREDPGKLPLLRPMIWQAVTDANLDKDLHVTEDEAFSDFDSFLERLHGYLAELSDTMINDGLHILGVPPKGDDLAEYAAQLTRLPNGQTPSLREAIVSAMGYKYDTLMDARGREVSGSGGISGGEIIEEAHALAISIVRDLLTRPSPQDDMAGIVETHLGVRNMQVEKVLGYIATDLVPRIRQTKEEISSTLAALSGRFVMPGPSGAPTRGQAEILPTGRNFYSVDPGKIPTRAAWETGKRLADALLERHLAESHGHYPESIGIIIWGGPTMRTRGDDIAEVLYLMGIKPVWARESDDVTGLEVIPLSRLKRPRIDVVARISGFFRDSFPNLVELLDNAARMAAALDESLESNLIRKNVLSDIEHLLKTGLDRKEALREATFRVFGCPPGTYGAGVSELIESKNWETREDLANNYIRYSAHAYGAGSYGTQKISTFRNLLSRMELTVKNEDSREYDMMSCTDFYNYYGGLIAAAGSVRGELPLAMVGDSADPRHIKMRTTLEEARHVLRSRLTNPKWLEGMKRHGFKGAGDISKMMDVVLGWDATAQVIEDWMYERLAEKFALDPEIQRWMKEVNPYALENILDKLLEAIERGMWMATDEMKIRLRDAYLRTEGEIEEISE